MIEPLKFFTEKFNIAFSDLEALLGISLSKGGDYADIYLEYTVVNSLNLEEQLVKSANRSVRQGAGVRVISGERT
ncbi:MAG: metalloprotease TldD, partial [Acidobacteria bacterium]|nr:metalloprotease TldD [Acidobacteriota bacterium]